jgi:hypothetical protein
MSHAGSAARVWRKNPAAFAPPALAFGSWFVSLLLAHTVRRAGDWPYSVPVFVVVGWAAWLHRRLYQHVPTRRRAVDRDDESVASILVRSPLGAAVLGVVGMAAYFLVVATLFGKPWLGDDAASGAYGIVLMGMAIALMGWEIVFGETARRRERHAQARRPAGKARRRDG